MSTIPIYIHSLFSARKKICKIVFVCVQISIKIHYSVCHNSKSSSRCRNTVYDSRVCECFNRQASIDKVEASGSKRAALAVGFLYDMTREPTHPPNQPYQHIQTSTYTINTLTRLHLLLTHLLCSAYTPSSTHPLSPLLNSLTPPTCVLSTLPSAPHPRLPNSPLIPPPRRLCADRSMSQWC